MPFVGGLKMQKRAADCVHPWSRQKQLGKLRTHVSKAPNWPKAEHAGHRMGGWLVTGRNCCPLRQGRPRATRQQWVGRGLSRRFYA